MTTLGSADVLRFLSRKVGSGPRVPGTVQLILIELTFVLNVVIVPPPDKVQL